MAPVKHASVNCMLLSSMDRAQGFGEAAYDGLRDFWKILRFRLGHSPEDDATLVVMGQAERCLQPQIS